MDGGDEPVILLYGRLADESEDSVCFRVYGVYPNFYVPKPSVASSPEGPINEFFGNRKVVHHVELVRRTPVHNFVPQSEFFRVYLNNYYVWTQLRNAIDEGKLRGGFSRRSYNTKLDYKQHALIELNLEMCGIFSVDDLQVSALHALVI